MEITFSELKCKEVISVCDGKRLGHVCDIVFSCNGCKVLGIVVPNERKLFRSREDTFIPWCNIQKIGEDVILVKVESNNGCKPCEKPEKNNKSGEKGGFDGDYIIEDE